MGEIFKKELPSQDFAYTGERYTHGHGVETEIEHYHRYFLARFYSRGKDVLDIACGEGYGSAILAQVASSIVGIDICEAVIAHAQTAHVHPNLKFVTGDVRKIPLIDQSVDVVVSFETLEHFLEHELFMREVKRVLRPDGCLILSTPNSDIYSAIGIPANSYHVHELTKLEFVRLCNKHFKCMMLMNQRSFVGSIVMNENQSLDSSIVLESRDKDYVEESKGLSRAPYLIAMLSDIEMNSGYNSVYMNESIHNFTHSLLEKISQQMLEKDQQIAVLKRIIKEKKSLIEKLLSIKFSRITKPFRLIKFSQKYK